MTRRHFEDQINTCRVCHEMTSGHLIKYGVRHYAHPACALRRWGAAFFDRLLPWQLENFPALAASEVGLYDELVRQIKLRPAEHTDYSTWKV